MTFAEIQRRLLAEIRERMRNGQISERRLAHLIGISQPHMHNVLKGARVLSPRIADRILSRLRMSLPDLAPEQGLRGCPRHCLRRPANCAEVPVLEGWLGPGLPLPSTASPMESYPFPESYLISLENPVLARLASDPQMSRTFSKNDLVLLDRSRRRRLHPAPRRLYVVNWWGEGVIRRLLRDGSRLHLLGDGPCGDRPLGTVSIDERHLLDVVRAVVIWVGRSLEES